MSNRTFARLDIGQWHKEKGGSSRRRTATVSVVYVFGTTGPITPRRAVCSARGVEPNVRIAPVGDVGKPEKLC